MKNKKRVVIALLSVAMFITMISGLFFVLKNKGTFDSSWSETDGEIGRNFDVCGGVVFLEMGTSYTMSGGTINGKDTKSFGGGVYVSDGATFKMKGGTINGCESNVGGAIYVAAGGTCIIEDGIINGCNAATAGGAIYVEAGGRCVVKDGEIKECSAKNGGAFFVETGASLEILGGEISGNIVSSEGSAIYVQDGGKLTIPSYEKDVANGVYLESRAKLNIPTYNEAFNMSSNFKEYDQIIVRYYVDDELKASYGYSKDENITFEISLAPLDYSGCVGWYLDRKLTKTVLNGECLYDVSTENYYVQATGGYIDLYTKSLHEGLFFELNTDGKSYTLSSIEDDFMGGVVIPQYYSENGTNYYPVTAIKNTAFKENNKITSVVIPATIETLPNGVFSGCSNLVTAALPNGLESIPERAFEKCTMLKNVDIPKSVESIGAYAFYRCDGLKSLTISSGVKSIGNWAFYFYDNELDALYIESIESWCNIDFGGRYYSNPMSIANNVIFLDCEDKIIIPNTITEIKAYAFMGYRSNKEIIISDSVTSIGTLAFYECTGLTEITIPDSVTSIGSSVFEGCTALTTIKMSENVGTISSGAFYNCTSLKTINIPNNVTYIWSGAFENCSEIKTINIPDGVISIGSDAFANAGLVGRIYLPSSINTLGDDIFWNCDSSLKIYVGWMKGAGPEKSSDIWDRRTFEEKFDVNYNYTREEFNLGIEKEKEEFTIVDNVLMGYDGLGGDVVIPEGVVRIDNSAFAGIQTITSVTIPASVVEIGEGAFAGCSLTTVIWAEGSQCRIIEGDAFYESGITSFEIPENVEEIKGFSVFYTDTLKTIILRSSHVGDLGEESLPENLERFIIGKEVKIGNEVLNTGTIVFELILAGVESVEIEEGNTCFYMLDGAIIQYGDEEQEKEYGGFDLDRLIYTPVDMTTESLHNILQHVGVLGAASIAQHSSLKTLIIPENVCKIEPMAILACTSLAGIFLPRTVHEIYESAFSYVPSVIFTNASEAQQEWDENWNYDAFQEQELQVVYDEAINVEFDSANERILLTISKYATEINPMSVLLHGYMLITEIQVEEGNQTFITNGKGLVSLDSPDGVTLVMTTCTVDNNDIKDLNGINSIGPGAIFSFMLTEVVIPESIHTIHAGAFFMCLELTKVVIPSTVEHLYIDEHFLEAFGINGDCGTFVGCNSDLTIHTDVSNDNVGWESGWNIDIFSGESLTVIYNSFEVQTEASNTNNAGNGEYDDVVNAGSSSGANDVTNTTSTTFNPDDYKDFKFSGTILTGYTGSGGFVTIPSGVTSIGERAFYNCTGVITISISNTVTSIGTEAFYECTGLTEITIPDSVTSIGSGALSTKNSNKTRVYIPSIEYWLTGLESTCSLVNCGLYLSGLEVLITDITISSNVPIIRDYVFYGYESLNTITISSSVTSIGSFAFSGCSKLTSVTIPDTVTNIGKDALTTKKIFNKTQVYIPSIEYWLTGLESNCSLEYCDLYINGSTSPATQVAIPTNVTIIRAYAFYKYSSLTSIRIPSRVRSIGDNAFYNCSELIDITIPSGVESIEPNTFSGCSKLTFVRIPSSVISIGDNAFYNCSKLIDLTIPSGVESIGKSAFYNCDGLTGITVPESVTSIGDDAFNSCSNLTSVLIEEGVKNIGSGVFSYCYGLTSIKIPSSVTNIGTDALTTKNSDKTQVYIPSIEYWLTGLESNCSLEYIDLYINGSTTPLTDITIPNNVTRIRDYAFYDYRRLISITIPNSVTIIGEAAFYYCSALTLLDLPSSVKQIGYESLVFGTGSSILKIPSLRYWLSEVETPSFFNIFTVGLGAIILYDKSRETEIVGGVEIPYGISEIPDYAFCGYKHITSTVIPSSVKRIGDYAFCFSSIEEATIEYGATSIGDCAFSYCDYLKSVKIPSSVTSIGNAFSSFLWDSALMIQLFVPSLNYWLYNVESSYMSLYNCELHFEDGSSITEDFIIPRVRNIRDYAFWEYRCFNRVFIPGSVVNIGEYAFGFNTLLNNDTFDVYCEASHKLDGWKENWVQANNYKTYWNRSLEMTKAEWYDGFRFNDNGGLVSYYGSATDLVIPYGTKRLEFNFDDLKNKTLNSLSLPETLEYIYCSFSGSHINHLYIESADKWCLIDFGSSTTQELFANSENIYFNGDSAPTEYLKLTGVSSIQDYAFKNCHQLKYVYVDAEKIYHDAFTDCHQLKYVYVDSGEIYYDAFTDCVNLKRLFLGKDVTMIHSSVDKTMLTGCSSELLVLCGGTKQFVETNFPAGWNNKTTEGSETYDVVYNCTELDFLAIQRKDYEDYYIYFSEGVLRAFVGSVADIVIPDYITEIGNYVFYENQIIESIIMSVGMNGIGDYAFYNCDNLSYIRMQTMFGKIGSYAFYDCDALTEIYLPYGVTKVGEYAFYGCENVAQVGIPDTLVDVEYFAFYTKHSETTKIYVSSTKVWLDLNIYGGSFSNVDLLVTGTGNSTKEIILTEDMTELNSKMFEDLSLERIYIPSIEYWLQIKFNGSIGNAKVYIQGEDSPITNITIPNEITTIRNYAFYSWKQLETITIPESVTSIGVYTFYGCDGLTEITVPESVTSVGDHAFSYCGGLTEITIPGSVTSIGDYAFYYCDNLTTVTIEEGVTSIGDYAFSFCSGLTEITIPGSVKNIGERAFALCDNLTIVTIEEGVTSIGNYMFYHCTNLTEITIPGSVTSIGNRAFYYCNNLTTVTIEEGVTSIGDHAFFLCSDLTEITIPGSVRSIGDYAFACGDNSSYSLGGLIKVIIEEGVTSIGNYMFYHCTNLTEITIPGSVTSIGDNALYTMNYGSTKVYIPSIEYWLTGLESNCSLSYCDLYINGSTTPLTDITIPNNVTRIRDHAFYDYRRLISITIPESVTSIGNDAFSYCRGLTEITIPGSVTSIGSMALSTSNSNKTVVYIPSLEYWLMELESNCSLKYCDLYINGSTTPLTDITIPNNVTIIRAYAFYDYDSLTSITIPGSVKNIGERAFAYCDKLTTVTIEEGVTSIGSDAFRDCSGITEITIPGSVTSIGSYAFAYCENLTTVTIEEGVTSIGSYTFVYCENLTTVTIKEGVTSIGSYAFRNCSSLETIYIPNSVINIGWHYFNSIATIYCESTAKPSTWENGWSGSATVKWGYSLEEYLEETGQS